MEAFYQRWILDLQNIEEELVTATKESSDDGLRLQELIQTVVGHFNLYHHQQSLMVESGDIFLVMNPSWINPFGRTFLWIGGWKPSLAFRLLNRGNVPTLSATQTKAVEDLRNVVSGKERWLADVKFRVQDTVLLLRFLGLVGGPTSRPTNGHMHVEEDDVLEEVDALSRTLLECADRLRSEIVTTLLVILSPLQAVVFLSTAINLYLSVWRFGTWQSDTENITSPQQ